MWMFDITKYSVKDGLESPFPGRYAYFAGTTVPSTSQFNFVVGDVIDFAAYDQDFCLCGPLLSQTTQPYPPPNSRRSHSRPRRHRPPPLPLSPPFPTAPPSSRESIKHGLCLRFGPAAFPPSPPPSPRPPPPPYTTPPLASQLPTRIAVAHASSTGAAAAVPTTTQPTATTVATQSTPVASAPTATTKFTAALAAIPPILDTPNSRMIYHDLDESQTSMLMSLDETGWQAVSAAILESKQGYPDTTIVEGLFLADHHCRPGGSMFEALSNVPEGDRNSLAYVNFGTRDGREGCVEVDPDHAVTLFTATRRAATDAASLKSL